MGLSIPDFPVRGPRKAVRKWRERFALGCSKNLLFVGGWAGVFDAPGLLQGPGGAAVGGWGGVFDAPALPQGLAALPWGVEDSAPATPTGTAPGAGGAALGRRRLRPSHPP